jgi:uncharacterized Tic20 family protein
MHEPNTPSTGAPAIVTPHPTERTFAVLAHMSTLLGYAIPFGQFLAPYTIQLLRGPESEFVLGHTREVLNFQLAVLALLLLGLLLSSVGIGWVVIAAALLHSLIQTVRGAQAASRSEAFRYPFTPRLLARTHHKSR